MAQRKGFGALLDTLGAIDARGKSVAATMGDVGRAVDSSDIESARAEVERLKAALESIAPERAGGMLAQLELAEQRLRELESEGGTRPDSGAGSASSSPVRRVAFQMGRMRAQVTEDAAEAERVLDGVADKADAIQQKISKQLALLLTGEGGSGPLSFGDALEQVERFIELKQLQKTARGGFEQWMVNDSIQKTIMSFQRTFGQLGDIRRLAKELEALRASMQRSEKDSLGPTSGTLGRDRKPAQATTSIAVLRWSGGLR